MPLQALRRSCRNVPPRTVRMPSLSPLDGLRSAPPARSEAEFCRIMLQPRRDLAADALRRSLRPPVRLAGIGRTSAPFPLRARPSDGHPKGGSPVVRRA